MSLRDDILTLTRQLYPGGRAFKMPVGGFLEKLHIALNNSEAKAFEDASSILYDILPDNDNFTADDATDWERRLGLIYSPAVPLDQRKLLIKNKLNQPGKNPAKGNYLYLQEQLQNAGFNVYVYENRFLKYPAADYETQTPKQLTGSDQFISYNQHGQFQHGQRRHGGVYNNKVVNNIDEKLDRPFDFAQNWKNTFFIGGSPVGSIANVPLVQRDQFRQLILKTKPVQTVGFLLINYT